MLTADQRRILSSARRGIILDDGESSALCRDIRFLKDAGYLCGRVSAIPSHDLRERLRTTPVGVHALRMDTLRLIGRLRIRDLAMSPLRPFEGLDGKKDRLSSEPVHFSYKLVKLVIKGFHGTIRISLVG